MKNKIIFCAAALLALLTSFLFYRLDHSSEYQRYHQHLEQPGENDLDPCQSCDGQSQLCTHLPIIRIETGGQKIPGAAILDYNGSILGHETGTNGEEEISVKLSTIEAAGVWHHADDPADQSSTARIHYRGNSSRSFSKHNYSIKLTQSDNPAEKQKLPLLGMSADHEWALHGPFLDKTLLRNYMWLNISAEIMGYAPNVRFCELILDGEYQGVYVLMETISQGDNRIDLTDYDPGDPVTSYIIGITSHPNPLKVIDNFSVYTRRLEQERHFEVIYPSLTYQTQQVHEYIRTDLSEIEHSLFSSGADSVSRTMKGYLDQKSFVDYYILQEFLSINDSFSNSTYFYRDVRGKLHIGPAWDYNNALDNFIRPFPADRFYLSQRGWYAQLMTNKDFVTQVIDRYRSLRDGILSDEYLNTYIDETVSWLGSAVDRNYRVWGYTFDVTQLSPWEYRRPYTFTEHETAADYNPANFDQAVQWMRDYMLTRGAWLDENIDSLRQYCSDSKNATRTPG